MKASDGYFDCTIDVTDIKKLEVDTYSDDSADRWLLFSDGSVFNFVIPVVQFN
jgi:hypothetical protein